MKDKGDELEAFSSVKFFEIVLILKEEFKLLVGKLLELFKRVFADLG